MGDPYFIQEEEKKLKEKALIHSYCLYVWIEYLIRPSTFSQVT